MIEVTNLTKRYGAHKAVDDLTFTVEPGIATGFLGPNGAGKSTTMRMILGLDRPTSGTALLNGRRLDDHPAPLHELGALLEAKAVHPRRSARPGSPPRAPPPPTTVRSPCSPTANGR